MSMSMKINTKIIEQMNPCRDRFNNWLKYYKNFNGDVLEFLALDKISANDKIWVTIRLLRDANDLFTIQVFAIDCSLSAAYAAYTADSAAAYTAAAAAYAAYAADSADAAAYAASAADSAAYTADSAAAYTAAYAAYAADSADAAAYAASAAVYAAERERQVDALAWLIKNRGKK